MLESRWPRAGHNGQHLSSVWLLFTGTLVGALCCSARHSRASRPKACRTAQRQRACWETQACSGTFIAVQDRGVTGPNVPFLIGITQDTGNGSCIEQHIGRRQTINSTRFDAGDYAISMKWSGCALKKEIIYVCCCAGWRGCLKIQNSAHLS